MSDNTIDRRALLLAGAGAATAATVLRFDSAEAMARLGKKRQTKTFKGAFRPGAADWHYLDVQVPRGVRKIKVSYETPDKRGGLISTNVVDIGIFDPSGIELGNDRGFRGWSGGARQSFHLSRTSATPGYLAGPITPGRWRIALGPYQVTDRAGYRVKVTLLFGKKGARFQPAVAPSAVPGTGPGWYRGDLHVHTVHSDGSQTQAEVISYARAAGLDFIGSSEHNTSSATRTWGRHVPADFLVINGEEVTTRAGHWLATGLPADTWIDWRYRPAPGNPELVRFADQVRSLGGLTIAAHPFQIGAGNGWGFGDDFAEIDALEVWNGAWTSFNATANEAAVAHWHRLLSRGVFKPAVGNSDSHRATQPLGLAQTVVRAETLSTEAIIEGYRRGHSWITGSAAVDLAFTATLDGEQSPAAECGDRLPSVEGQLVRVLLTLSGVPAGSVARIKGPDALEFATGAFDEDGVLTLGAEVPGGMPFVRAEVRTGPSPTDPMVALTNPIFLTAAQPG